VQRYLIILAFAALVQPGDAALYWDGNAALGMKVMKLPNAEDGSTITVVDDPIVGKAFSFHKVKGSNRCEAHGVAGFQAKEGNTLYIGWRSKLSLPASNLTTNAVFQWKAYGGNMQQNYPVVIKTLNGRLTLEHYAPGKIRTEVWSAPVVLNAWMSLVLCIHVSTDGKAGYLEFWYNGRQQTLAKGVQRYYCRTFDAESVDPKWGIYGAANYDMTNMVGSLRIAGDYAGAAPERPALVIEKGGDKLNLRYTHSGIRYDLAGKRLEAFGSRQFTLPGKTASPCPQKRNCP
jgi:hypothetical protein